MMESVKARKSGIDAAGVTTFFVFLVLGALFAARPFGSLGLLGAMAALGCAAVVLTRSGLASLVLWQILALTALFGYVVLGYGFANLAFHLGGIPVILGHTLMFAALGLAVISSLRGAALAALREPSMFMLLILLLMTIPHLALDIPHYGFYAVRDASVFFEGIFLLLGLLWASDRRNTEPLLKWLLIVFLVNLAYCYTFPWGESLSSWSFKSGIFLVVPLLGDYMHSSLYLVLGALFCLWLGPYVARWPGWIWILVVLAQLGALAIHQMRSTYLGIVLVLILLAALGEIRKVATLAVIVSLGLMAILFFTSFLGIQISGRIGPVNLAFLEAHARSLLFQRGTPELISIEGREDWYSDVWHRVQSSTANLIFGEGFGQPLISFVEDKGENGGVAVRQPHNIFLSVLARMGLLGLSVWVLFHFFIVKRFLSVFRRRSQLDKRSYALVLFLFFVYLLSMLTTSVQAALEFSYFAIPFYFMMGFALGFMRWQLYSTEHEKVPWRNVAKSVEGAAFAAEGNAR
jgi:O-antigen ligase